MGNRKLYSHVRLIPCYRPTIQINGNDVRPNWRSFVEMIRAIGVVGRLDVGVEITLRLERPRCTWSSPRNTEDSAMFKY